MVDRFQSADGKGSKGKGREATPDTTDQGWEEIPGPIATGKGHRDDVPGPIPPAKGKGRRTKGGGKAWGNAVYGTTWAATWWGGYGQNTNGWEETPDSFYFNILVIFACIGVLASFVVVAAAASYVRNRFIPIEVAERHQHDPHAVRRVRDVSTQCNRRFGTASSSAAEALPPSLHDVRQRNVPTTKTVPWEILTAKSGERWHCTRKCIAISHGNQLKAQVACELCANQAVAFDQMIYSCTLGDFWHTNPTRPEMA